jgi:hypothetical protein
MTGRVDAGCIGERDANPVNCSASRDSKQAQAWVVHCQNCHRRIWPESLDCYPLSSWFARPNSAEYCNRRFRLVAGD